MSVAADVVVIGAGISGLVAAHELMRRGAAVQMVEAGPRPGGVIGTCARDGSLYEVGPNSTLDTTPLIDTLLERLALRDQRIDASAVASRRFVVRGGVPMVLPMSPGAFAGTRAFSTLAKLRLLREPFIAPAPPDAEESIAAFVRRRLGREFLDYAVDPFVAGIYAGDPEEISVKAAFPRLHALEQRYGSLIRGQIQGRRERARSKEPAKNTARSFSFGNGMHVLPTALAASLPDVLLGAPVQGIARMPDGRFQVTLARQGRVESRSARVVVCAAPAPAAADIVQDFDAAAAAALRQFAYAPVVSVASLYRREDVQHPLDGFGFLVPRVEGRRILGTLFSSSMFPGRAPAGYVLLTTFAGGRRNPDVLALDDDAIRAVVAEELAGLVGAHGTAAWHAITRWRAAIPQYTLGHFDRVGAVEAAEQRAPGLFFCASYRGGVSVGDCVKSAHATAERAAAHLAT